MISSLGDRRGGNGSMPRTSKLSSLADNYKLLPSTFVAEHSEEIQGDKFEGWCKDPSNSSAVIEKLVQQFEVARGKKGQTALSEEDRARSKAYTSCLRDDKLASTRVELM